MPNTLHLLIPCDIVIFLSAIFCLIVDLHYHASRALTRSPILFIMSPWMKFCYFCLTLIPSQMGRVIPTTKGCVPNPMCCVLTEFQPKRGVLSLTLTDKG